MQHTKRINLMSISPKWTKQTKVDRMELSGSKLIKWTEDRNGL